MKTYGKVTNLCGSDRHVLNSFGSEFFEYSPESIQVRKTQSIEPGLLREKSITNTFYPLKNKLK